MKEAFLKAVVAGNVDSLSLLLEDGADVEFAFEHGRTALHIAADTGNVSAAKALIEAQANVNAKDDRGMSPLQLASAFGNLPLVELLLSNKADVASADAFGFTALHSAVFFGRVHIVDVLLKTKADLGAVTKSGDTPLSLAELGGNFVLVGKLKARTVQNISDEMPKLEKAVSTKKDDMPPMEPIKPKQTSVDVKAAKPVSSVAAKTIVNTEIVDIDADTQWTPTDTYGSTKKKLELANKIIAELKKQK